MNISVQILTLNEASNIDACLDSVAWSDDILVVDSFSTDATVEMALAHGAGVIQRKFDHFAGQRNFGLEEGGLRHRWVLHLDADERVTPALRDELLAIAETDDSEARYEAYRVPSKMIFRGKWLKRSGMYPTYQVRFGTRNGLLFEQVGHGQREVLPSSKLGTIKEPLLHYSFSNGMDDWFARHNRYSTDEALHAFNFVLNDNIEWSELFDASDPMRRRRALKAVSYRVPFRSAFRFFYMYILRGGFLDGRAGLEYSKMMAAYEYMVGAKLRTLRKGFPLKPSNQLKASRHLNCTNDPR